MLSYEKLTTGQRKWVDLVEALDLLGSNKNEVTYKQIEEIHQYLIKQRAVNKKFKVAKPIWLISNNAIRRGVYAFPFSRGYNASLRENPSAEEIAYQNELRKFNIIL